MFKKWVLLLSMTFMAFGIMILNVQGKPATEPAIAPPPVSQIIVQFSEEVNGFQIAAENMDGRIQQLSDIIGVNLQYARPMSGNAHVLKLPAITPLSEAEAIAAEIAQQDGVAYAEPDYIRQAIGGASLRLASPLLTPNDPMYGNQWHYTYAAGTSEGLNLPAAWNINTGSASTVVAVIDTGILPHADLAGRTVSGYDFISDSFVGNDGDGRDSDPSDPGDWVTTNQCGYPHSARNSSWHGTHVAGTIGAATNNSVGVAGVNWNAKILAARVLGKCGGATSDIVDAMRWSAGLSVSGVPVNANPADVLNLSLGGSGSCSTSEQNAINEIVAAGGTVVVAAGNDNVDASDSSPANCNSVITVASNDRTGDKAYYSNYGSVVEVTAPGGETTTSTNGVLSTLDGGTTGPLNDNVYAYYQGTSMAAPHVAGVVSLVIAEHPGLTPGQISQHLQDTARAFPGGSSCNTSICGAGIVDAHNALSTAPVEYDEFVYLPIVLKSAPLPDTLFSTGDTMIAQNYATSNFCSLIEMLAGYDDYNNGRIVRSLIQFDVSDIPSGTTINQATLNVRLYSSYDFPNTSRTITTYRIGSSWSACSATWNNQPTIAEAYGSQPVNHQNVDDWFAFDVTNLVRGWVNGSYANYGVWLRGPEQSGNNSSYRSFYTMDSSSDPYLSITYPGTTGTGQSETTRTEVGATPLWFSFHEALGVAPFANLCQSAFDDSQKCLNIAP
ncbi:MAG: S8 family serine peptidase [Chloroflexi bacterium]|nr:S8 family serine peptidase [Chloroflexota bacterium]